MRARSSRARAVPVLALGAIVIVGCRGDASVVEIVPTDDPSVIEVLVDTCNADLDVSVDESDDVVVVDVRNQDRSLFPSGGDDCQDLVTIELDSPLGDRELRLGDGTPIAVTTVPVTSELAELPD